MKMIFDEAGVLLETDYWETEAGALAGAVWVTVRRGCWHLLAPRLPEMRVRAMVAMPVTAAQEPEGWQWKLWLDLDWAVHVPLRHFLNGRCPPLPEAGQSYLVNVQLYGYCRTGLYDRVLHNFGHFETGVVPKRGTGSLRVLRAGPGWREQMRRWLRPG